ncbi:MAG TPA: 2Fe-2S iron-sulfur cluster binding domain-containing protein, partial [Clostridia bacterium]|nr:2Fe-2S iron-sulfur cluster binding domain-containing protein [Clostridia bacterium]
MKKHTVTFLPDKVKVTVEAGTTLMAAAAEAGVEFEGPCGGRGVCGKCRMRILEGGAPGWVLACQTAIHGDLVVEIPQQEIYLSRKTALTLGELAVEIDPGLNKRKVRVQPPSIEHQVSDATRLLTALGEPAVLKLGVLRALPSVLREAQHQVTLIMKGTEVIALEPGDTEEEPLYGLAVDIGTTTVVGTLVDLKTGKNVAAASAGNTQNI